MTATAATPPPDCDTAIRICPQSQAGIRAGAEPLAAPHPAAPQTAAR
jgi:hypothetical protein